MSDFFEKTARKQKARREWIFRFKDSYERARQTIMQRQERKLLTLQIILLVFLAGFLINFVSTSFYNFLFNPLNFLNNLLFLSSLFILACIFFYVRNYFLLYKPPVPTFVLSFKPEDLEHFIEKPKFKAIQKYLADRKLRDFKTFGENFFERLEGWFRWRFREKISVIGKEEKLEEASKEYPTIIREYDLSQISGGEINFHLEIHLIPDVIYVFGTKGDQTSARDFTIFFGFQILNSEHPNAGKFLDYYYHTFLGYIPEFTSLSLVQAFNVLLT